MEELTCRALLQMVMDKGASDIHFSVGSPPQLRVDGGLIPACETVLNPETAKRLSYEMLRPDQIKAFEEDKELDCAVNFDGKARFRVNVFYQQNSVSAALRIIPTKIPDARAIGIPDIAMKVAERPRGLILVTGPTGSGKSTTLAAMIDQINQTRDEHIITIEDPIEFVHQSKKCLVVQREVGEDTKTFGAALKRILRQDPDIVLVGELRDLETISAAITISETGHLVFGTLHTNTAVQTINRIIDVFPASQQEQVRAQLSFILEGVFSQQLVPKVNGGRCLAMEILIPTMGIRNLIRENKIHQLHAAMQMGQAKTGMMTMNQSLVTLYKKQLITREDCMGYATEKEEMEKLIGGAASAGPHAVAR